MKQAGKLIIFEGSDGAGKSTQVALLIKQLKKAGCLVGQLHFPQYGLFFGRLIRRYLKGEFGSIKQTNCYLGCRVQRGHIRKYSEYLTQTDRIYC